MNRSLESRVRRAYQQASPRLRHGGDVGDDRINVGIGHQLGVGGHERIGAHALAHTVAFERDRQVLGLENLFNRI